MRLEGDLWTKSRKGIALQNVGVRCSWTRNRSFPGNVPSARTLPYGSLVRGRAGGGNGRHNATDDDVGFTELHPFRTSTNRITPSKFDRVVRRLLCPPDTAK